MSEIKYFPKWLYHKTETAMIVQDEAEQKALGKEWHESPVNVPAPSIEQELQHDFEVIANEDEVAAPTYKEHMAGWESKSEKAAAKKAPAKKGHK